jgi:hypothetical protein
MLDVVVMAFYGSVKSLEYPLQTLCISEMRQVTDRLLLRLA